ncbi:hypothetical protein GP486_001653 [Trichoglossum hirsutum]|uniref:DUF1996 domain-containing protein n=1 Tax=Trichoglossum hirsutum TaxID=265104 RepID=A0A9P8LGF6_9PEZI|nr:hypothetical protein GP486_001653 [Trichoglossum hirsutum]
MTSTYSDLMASSGTSCAVPQDKSAYWTPGLYFMGVDGTTELVDQVGGMLAYYFLNGENIQAFPRGFQMIAGDTRQRNFTWPVPDPPKSSWSGDQVSQKALSQKAIGFNCLDYNRDPPEPALFRHFLPDKSYLDANCINGVRFEIMFPSCWNGKDADSPDHKSHVAYPNLVNTGDCPDGFTHQLPGLFYETIWNTYAFKDKTGTFVISNGDPTGYGYHGDFITGWDPDFLQSAVTNCTNPSGQVEDCQLFNSTLQSESEQQKHKIAIPPELQSDDCIGLRSGLPGNVPVQSGPGYASEVFQNPPQPTSRTVPNTPTSPATTIASASPSISGADVSVEAASDHNQPPLHIDSPTAVTTTLPPSPPQFTAVTTLYHTTGARVDEVIVVEEIITVPCTTTSTASLGNEAANPTYRSYLFQKTTTNTAPVTRAQAAKDMPSQDGPAGGSGSNLVSPHEIQSVSADGQRVSFDPNGIPTYTIDLSLQPSQRYVKLARDFQDSISDLVVLFDEIIHGVQPSIRVSVIKFLSRALLRRVYSEEETEELRGISEATGVEMFLLVALNTFLDLFMGCTSGGVRTRDSGNTHERRMLHFRTLDWGMDSLRQVLVNLEFVREPGSEVIARSITYAGFVGVLTGVRRNLSISLNFRPNHNGGGLIPHIRFYMHHLLVLFGFRPAIASTLRGFLLSGASSAPRLRKVRRNYSSTNEKASDSVVDTAPSLALIAEHLPKVPTTAAYIIFCDGTSTMVLEKDLRTAVVRERRDFIVATNNDENHESDNQTEQDARKTIIHLSEMAGLIEESINRKGCIRRRWRKAVRHSTGKDPDSFPTEDQGVAVTMKEVVRWVNKFPTTNECTHFACVMDPKDGKIVYVRRYQEPITMDF